MPILTVGVTLCARQRSSPAVKPFLSFCRRNFSCSQIYSRWDRYPLARLLQIMAHTWLSVSTRCCHFSATQHGVCVSAGTPAQLHIASCRICTYASFQLSRCQPPCCSCCRFASVAPANSIGLTKWPDSTVFFVNERVGGTINALPSQRRAAAMVDCWKSCIINLAETPSARGFS